MIQKNKFIFKFIYGVLVDEECESAKIISTQDLSKLVKSLENTATKNINIIIRKTSLLIKPLKRE